MPARRPTGPPRPAVAAASPDAPSGALASGPLSLMRDILIPHVLLAVSLHRTHGYLIQEYLRELGFVDLEISTLYRTLRHLEESGLLASSWQPGPAGPARRVYALTNAGGTWLESWAGALAVYRGVIDRFFGLYGPPLARPVTASQPPA